METILLVEDERKLNDMIRDYLVSLGYEVRQCFDGHAALARFARNPIDLIVLDLMIPGPDGIEVARMVRKERDCPIIMLTARDTEADKLLGLEVGADDYMTKPFSVRELEARIRAILRRARRQAGGSVPRKVFSHGGIDLDLNKHQVLKDGRSAQLTSAQFELLRVLIQEPGRVFSRRELIAAISGHEYDGYERTIDVQVKNIRKAIEGDPANPDLIQTVRGVGYRLKE